MQIDYRLVALLAGLTALGPFALQILAPALPAAARDLEVSAGAAQLLLSLSLAAMAVTTLIWGPLSDRLGRRPVMLMGVAIALLGSLIAALAPTLEVAILGRLLQAGGAIAGMVLGRAIAHDLYGRDGSAAVLGQITAVMVIAPMVAPTLSGLIVGQGDWRGIFWAVAFLSALLLVAAAIRLPETAPRSVLDGHEGESFLETLRDTARGFREIGALPAFWAYAGFGVMSLSGFLFFVGAAPFVMEEAFGRGPTSYGLWFMLMAAAYMAGNFAVGAVSRRLGGDRTLRFGAVISILGVLVAVVLSLGGLHHPAALVVPVMLQSVGAGLAVPNAMAGATAAVPERAGAASGLMGSCQFLAAGAATQIAGLLPHDTALPLCLGMLVLLGAGLAVHLWLSGWPEGRLAG
ncbi:MAG: multidrug effflux MFS transporter [Pseudomonadota bacterium]